MGGLFRVLLLLGFVITFWWVLLLVLAAVVACWLALVVWTRHDAELERRRRADAAIVARAGQQHALMLAGDDRGIYGEYTHEGMTGPSIRNPACSTPINPPPWRRAPCGCDRPQRIGCVRRGWRPSATTFCSPHRIWRPISSTRRWCGVGGDRPCRINRG
jgi:hypothetical protein